VLCNQPTSSRESPELAAGKSTDGPRTEEVKSVDAADAEKLANPPSLVDLATQCVSAGTVPRRAWADSPMEPAAMQASGGLCYELDPTPQEAAAAAAAAAAATTTTTTHKPTSSDSGGEDSAKENRESAADRSDNGKGAKKKGL